MAILHNNATTNLLVFGNGKLLFHELSLSSAEKTQSAFTQLRRLRETLYEFAGEIPHIKPSHRFYHFRKSAKDENKLV